MTNQSLKLSENLKKQFQFEHENFNGNSLLQLSLEVERWKMKVEMISSIKVKEIQKMDEKLIELKNLQDKVFKKRIENCDFIHNLIKNSWIAKLGNNLRCNPQNAEIIKSNYLNTTGISGILNKLEEELNEIKSILEGLNLTRQQEKKLFEYMSKINDIELSITQWNNEILKIESVISKSKTEQ